MPAEFSIKIITYIYPYIYVCIHIHIYIPDYIYIPNYPNIEYVTNKYVDVCTAFEDKFQPYLLIHKKLSK